MSESKFKNLRHIETVRNILDTIIIDFIKRGELHDKTKLESPEVEIFEEFTPKLRDSTYGSEEYYQYLKEMKVALDHHYKKNSHHPEFYENGILGMNLLDLVEMLADWWAATMRHADGDLIRSINQNQERFGYSDELKQILLNTVEYMKVECKFQHKAEES